MFVDISLYLDMSAFRLSLMHIYLSYVATPTWYSDNKLV